jgi:hypothetical protein
VTFPSDAVASVTAPSNGAILRSMFKPDVLRD